MGRQQGITEKWSLYPVQTDAWTLPHVWITCQFLMSMWLNVLIYVHLKAPLAIYSLSQNPVLLGWWFICFWHLKKINLLGLHWLIKLYSFQVHNSMIHPPYVLLGAHHPKSNLPSPCIWPPFPFTTPYLLPSCIFKWQLSSLSLHPPRRQRICPLFSQ